MAALSIIPSTTSYHQTANVSSNVDDGYGYRQTIYEQIDGYLDIDRQIDTR